MGNSRKLGSRNKCYKKKVIASKVTPTTIKPSCKLTSSNRKLKVSSNQNYYETLDENMEYDIVNLDKLLNVVYEIDACKNCFHKLSYEKYYIEGLAFKVKLFCPNCDASQVVENCPRSKEVGLDYWKTCYDLNLRLVHGLRSIGKGVTAARVLLGCMNLSPPPKLYKKYETRLSWATELQCKESMKRAAEESIASNGSPDLTVAVDGSWQKRGHTSLNGILSVTSLENSKVLNVSIMSKFCLCSKREENQHDTSCKANYLGTSGGMEIQGALEVFSRSEALYGARYVNFLGDGDSKAYVSVRDANVYGADVVLNKLECVGHVQKRLGKRLIKLKSISGKVVLEDGKKLGGKGRLSQSNILSLQTYYGLAIRRNTHSVDAMKKAIWAGYFHALSTNENPRHQLCPKDNLSKQTIMVDFSSNNISEIGEMTFANLDDLEELILADNRFQKIHPKAFSSNSRLKRLSLQNCGLVDVPWEAFNSLTQLTSLQLDQNEIWKVEATSFQHLTQLRNLRLESNKLRSVPTEALASLTGLEALNIGSNLITSITFNAFPELRNLIILSVKRNQISLIDDDAFANLTSLRVLELDDNLLTLIPPALTKLTALQELSVSGNRIKYIPSGILQQSQGLALLELKGNPLVGVDPHAFSFLPKLRKLILSDARELTEFPSLNGTSALEILRLDRASLYSVPSSLCRTCPRLKSLDLKSNKLSRVPDVLSCRDLRVLDLVGNRITSLEGKLFYGLNHLHDLHMGHNLITRLPQDAFHGLSRLQVLDLESNLIEYIHPEAFLMFTHLEDLNLGNNIFPNLPTAGLDRLLHLKTFNNPKLREFPPPESFPRIQTLVLSYAYHCCAFIPLIPAEAPTKVPLQESVLFPTDTEFDMSLWNSSLTDIWPQLQNLSKKFGTQINDLWDSFGSDFTYPGNLPAYVEEYFEEQENGRQTDSPPGRIQCLPTPGPFLPCVDLFDFWTLRCGVWVVFLLAMLGNGTVVFVLIFSRSKIDVPRFLVCNLAAADFFMGVYLGLLAVVDASTLGEFRMYAIPWQMSAGCQLAGFLGVLSSELSVYTLAVITLERNYAITHAMHLNKRLSLKHASYIMLCGWTFATIMAMLPLFEISDYRKFATCLPFETTTGPGSLIYVVSLMFINGVAFLILMGCYLKMYCAIRGSQAWNSNDSRIAKRMALLVFTDFLCWSPIAFFSLTAAFGLQLVTLEQAKVFTVFVLPLNSCCNPFLYAILTKQFKKDCVLICKAIEESRVTRGIGRCRHSSNFSNRQTPANTNSLVDRSSREHNHPHQPCSCNVKLLSDIPNQPQTPRVWLFGKFRSFLMCLQRGSDSRHRTHSDQYAYQIAEIQQKQHKRASSVSSSDNFSSSRSDSWRQNHHHCGIPMRLLDPKRRASSWIVTRKTSQDSNLSSSRNDSSGSATTASTTMSRVSRSSASSDTRTKPRLTRQSAIQDDNEPPGSPAKLTVRFLTTIPSAAETSVQQDDDPAPCYAILHASPEPSPTPSHPVNISPRQRKDFSPNNDQRSPS